MLAKLASRNQHKARELERALPGWRIELLDAAEPPPEEGETYYENARAKALVGRSLEPKAWILGEDSGIEVDALGGRPGVHSARWAKPGHHIEQLLAELQGVEDRRARYRCELVCLSPAGELRGSGTLEGTIATEPRGSEGFGYDPVFIPEGQTQTVAQLGNDWKVENSHRARAARALLKAIH
ncbi:MAG TPA: non-canonical purine NTP pyrophosphatase [Gaiellaceae bacterium]